MRIFFLGLFAIFVQFSSLPVQADNSDDARQAYDQGDYATAFGIWTKLAEHGDADAQYSIGRACYHKPSDIGSEACDRTPSTKLGLDWFIPAAKSGHNEAFDMLVHIHRKLVKERQIKVSKENYKLIEMVTKGIGQASQEKSILLMIDYLQKHRSSDKHWYNLNSARDIGYGAKFKWIGRPSRTSITEQFGNLLYARTDLIYGTKNASFFVDAQDKAQRLLKSDHPEVRKEANRLYELATSEIDGSADFQRSLAAWLIIGAAIVAIMPDQPSGTTNSSVEWKPPILNAGEEAAFLDIW